MNIFLTGIAVSDNNINEHIITCIVIVKIIIELTHFILLFFAARVIVDEIQN